MEFLIQNGPLLLGVLMCAAVALQLSFWTASGLIGRRKSGEEFRASMREFDRELASKQEQSGAKNSKDASEGWNGLRKFSVARLVREADDITSVYLEPQDKKPLPSFEPGQFLTFQLDIPQQNQSVVRCYSLSDGPREDYYRCSIKRVLPPADRDDLPPGVSSSFFNHQLNEGDTLQVKAPSGSFFLDTNANEPVVLLAGGIGVTPMVSMIKTIIVQQPNRKVVLFYGVPNSRSHAFASELAAIISEHENIKVVTCYSKPLPEDVAGKNYQVQGRVSAELLARLLPSPDFKFYLCGPPAFMESLYDGLIAWGASEDAVHFESFGPASVKKAREVSTDEDADSNAAAIPVVFEGSDKKAQWDGSHDSILELAESAGIEMESGCRSGSCGTCATRIIFGKFEHIKEVSADLNDDECLVCVARPIEELKIDA